MGSEHDHKGGVEPSWAKHGDADYQWKHERKDERDLHAERVHRVSLGESVGVSHPSQYKLGYRKDEKSTQNQDQFSQMQ